MQKPHLTRLAETHGIVNESSTSKQLSAICRRLTEPRIVQDTTACCSGSTFPRVTMCDHNILWVLFQPFVHFINYLEQQMKWRGMMILKDIVANSILESFLWIFSWTHIKDPVLSFMVSVQESLYIRPFIPPKRLNTWRWKAHDYYSILTNIGKIDIETIFLHSSSWSTNLLL